MFIVAIALVSFGYAVMYSGLSLSKGYRTQRSKGGIPLPQLLGVPARGTTKYSSWPSDAGRRVMFADNPNPDDGNEPVPA